MSLDDFRPPHPLLEAKFKQFMDAYELASDGKTTSFGSKVTAGEKSNPAPQSAHAQEMGYWAREWRRRKTDRTRLELLKVMQEAVVRLKFSPDTTRPGTLEWKQKIAFDEREPEVVQETFGISRATYYRIRGALNLTRPRRR